MSLSTRIYALGFLLLHGAQHGYGLGRLVSGSSAGVARIKPSTLYYHLERLLADGLVDARREQVGRRPQRSVYSVTRAGRDAFAHLLEAALAERYDPDASVEPAVYFSRSLPPGALARGLTRRAEDVRRRMEENRLARSEAAEISPRSLGRLAALIHDRRAAHLEAELGWIERALEACGDPG